MNSIEKILKQLMINYVSFKNYSENDLLKINNITTCYNESDCKYKRYCKKDKNNNCILMIPNLNLINNQYNNNFYYAKLADEIIRYTRINSFMFDQKTLLNFSKLNYNLRDNEIILLQSLLTQEYFDNITLAKDNSFVKYNSHNTSQPQINQVYSTVFDNNSI